MGMVPKKTYTSAWRLRSALDKAEQLEDARLHQLSLGEITEAALERKWLELEARRAIANGLTARQLLALVALNTTEDTQEELYATVSDLRF